MLQFTVYESIPFFLRRLRDRGVCLICSETISLSREVMADSECKVVVCGGGDGTVTSSLLELSAVVLQPPHSESR